MMPAAALTPLDLALGFLYIALAFGVVTGVRLVARRNAEDSLIGLNVAVICTVTALVAFHHYELIAFSRDIAFYFIFPGVIGVIAYAKFLRGGVFA